MMPRHAQPSREELERRIERDQRKLARAIDALRKKAPGSQNHADQLNKIHRLRLTLAGRTEHLQRLV
ncbi:hypothetical protein [Streptomyces crystallinus]|uniref:DUF465 domain-containing protein n=1 Tax=Streptomyces crystallinus TaxID=68191 RepID=A0ABP3RPS4_9ACTN